MSTNSFPGITMSSATQNLTQARSSQAQSVLQSEAKTGDKKKIEKAARDFESILLGEWLEKAETSFATVPGSNTDKDQDPGHDQFQSIGCQFLSEGLSRAGGIGIASMISKHLQGAEASREAEKTEAASNQKLHAKP